MDHLEFFRYHNRLIQFTYNRTLKKGVVLDIIPYRQKKRGTDYVFISYENLETWRVSSQEDRNQFQELINIKHISKAELLGLQHA